MPNFWSPSPTSPGIRRVRFTTSHPRDFGRRHRCRHRCGARRICNHIHLPVQSGSTRVLRAMQRTYTREEYLEKIGMIRGARRPISITSDIIVGFPGRNRRRLRGDAQRLLDVAQFDSDFLPVFAAAQHVAR